MNRENIRWITSFVVLAGIFYWINQSQWFQDTISDKLAILNAIATTGILSLLGVDLQQAGTTIVTATVSVEIAESCTGTLVFLILAAAILPFPASWKSRLKGITIGLLALILINLFRTCLITLVVSRFPGGLWTWHIVIGQIVIITGMIGFFVWWARDSQQHARFAFLRTNRTIFRALLFFSIGYICGYQAYQIFLESSWGIYVKGLIETHTLWILSLLSGALVQTPLSQYSPYPVNLIDGCLASPMVVLFVAIVFAWPIRWWKRFLIIFLGFIPFFYLYHLIRALLIAMSLGIQPREFNLAYNLYGQIVLCMAILGWTAYFWCSRKRPVSYKRFSTLFLIDILIAALIGSGFGWVARHTMIPFLTERIAGSTFLSYDPEQAISLTLDLQIFLWVSLVGVTPGLKMAKKGLLIVLGIVVALSVFTIGVAAIETFHLVPHRGLYKLLVVLMPFAVYYICLLHPNIKAMSTRSGQEKDGDLKTAPLYANRETTQEG